MQASHLVMEVQRGKRQWAGEGATLQRLIEFRTNQQPRQPQPQR